MPTEFVNISAYKFVPLDDLQRRRESLLCLSNQLQLKGTILLADEGINLFVAGSRGNIDQMLAHLQSVPEYSDLPIKESVSDHQPFNRMLVRLKKEIISMGVPQIKPVQKTSPKISAEQLKQWLDEGRDVTLLDVRNDYEIELGTFEQAVPIGVDHFRKFPDAVDQLPEELKQKPVVMFCTGGIRCEKAGPLMEEKGFQNVLQLEGGILRYFENCGESHYQGECFVFDHRVAVGPDLQETPTTQCYACREVLTSEDQQSPLYDPPNACPKCFRTDDEKLAERLTELQQQLATLTSPLPGSQPYDNVRPMNVPLACDQQTVLDFLTGLHKHLDADFWTAECEAGRVCYKDRPLSVDERVRASWRIEHLRPQTVEPDVNNRVEFLYEDDAIIVVNKPAPLPMHASGRFNRNTLIHFLDSIYAPEKVRIVHRLDADTTGVVVLGRKSHAAKRLQKMFAEDAGQIEKVYLARVSGNPDADEFVCDQPISSSATEKNGGRTIDVSGQPARTEFRLLKKFDDGTSLLECRPITGRTNQIRLHLQHLELPIVGDRQYGKRSDRDSSQPMCLHAWRLGFNHPVTGEQMQFEAPMPHMQ